ncbi:MAG: hypothetical protein GEU90_22605 [Gemmatimonas sp.]|nr:hypothetical protein [Gemmatimonas sp.]
MSADKILLDGTTIEEVEKYHAETLRLVVNKVNADADSCGGSGTGETRDGASPVTFREAPW